MDSQRYGLPRNGWCSEIHGESVMLIGGGHVAEGFAINYGNGCGHGFTVGLCTDSSQWPESDCSSNP